MLLVLGRVTRLPKYFGVKYYEVVENKFYKMTDAVLPQQRIYNLFQQKTVEDYSGNVISKYDQVKVSLLPQGVVWTFAQGLGNRRELGLYQAKEMVIPPKRAASKSRINTSPAFSAGRVSLLKPSYAFALE